MKNNDMPIKKELTELQLTWILQNCDQELANAARRNLTHQEFLMRLLEGELDARHARAVERRLREAKIGGVRTLDGFDFSWPTVINADHVRHLFTLNFMREKANVVFIGTVGLGKTHLAMALAREACMRRINVLSVSAISIVNQLLDAQQHNSLTSAINRFTRPALLVIDELGYLPVDKLGAELLFQVLCGRYEKASTIITTNREYKKWGQTFAGDGAMATAVLDRVTHHSETVIIKGKSYRTKGRIADID